MEPVTLSLSKASICLMAPLVKASDVLRQLLRKVEDSFKVYVLRLKKLVLRHLDVYTSIRLWKSSSPKRLLSFIHRLLMLHFLSDKRKFGLPKSTPRKPIWDFFDQKKFHFAEKTLIYQGFARVFLKSI